MTPSLKSVNWTTGMLLTPDHFLAQDAFVETVGGWALRNLSSDTGLVGGNRRGIEPFDPDVVDVSDDGTTVSAVVRSARGVTTSGAAIDFSGADAITGTLPRDEATNRAELYVAIVNTGRREPDPGSLDADDENRGQPAYRRPTYAVTLVPDAASIGDALIVARLQRGGGGRFVRDPEFIPPCVTVTAHKLMAAEWKKLLGFASVLAEGFADLHRHAATYVGLLERLRGPAFVDRGILAFIERTALACDTCAYMLLDPATSPDVMFRQIALAGRRASIALDLLTQASEFLRVAPETNLELGQFLKEERDALKGEIDASPVRDLRTAVKSATVTFGQLTELRRIVNEKYDDHRVCRVLVRLPYLLDRGTVPRVFDTIKHVSFTQEGAMRRFVFTDLVGLRPGNFRIALVGQADQNYVNWPEGTVISASVLVTAAAGGTPRNVPANLLCERPDQRNFTIDLDQMTTSGMSTIRVDVMSRSEVFEHAVLYRLYDGEAHPTIVEPVKAPEAGTPSRSRLDGIRVSI